MDAATIHGVADGLNISAEVLAECAVRVGAIEFGSQHAGRAHADAGEAVQLGFRRLGRALAQCGAGAARSGALLRSNVAAVVRTDRDFAGQLEADR